MTVLAGAAALLALLLVASAASAWSTNQPAQGYKGADTAGGAAFNPREVGADAGTVALADDCLPASPTSGYIPFPSGFDFEYFRQDANRVRISNNMYVVVDSTGHSIAGSCQAYNAGPLPSVSVPNNMVAAFWRDMFPDTTYHWSTGTAPNRVFVVQFTEYSPIPWSAGASTVTAQVQFHEKDNAIEIHYINAANVNGAVTIGVEGCGGARGIKAPTSLPLTGNVYRFEPLDNVAPTAVDQSYSVDEDDTLSVVGNGVLQGAQDDFWCHQPLKAELVGEGPKYAKDDFSLASNGRFTYTPEPDFYGVDSFTYQARDEDGATSETMTVTITVAPKNDAPRFVGGADQEDVTSGVAVSVDGWATAIDQGGPFSVDDGYMCTPPDGNMACMDGLTVQRESGGTVEDETQRLAFATTFSSEDGLEFSDGPVVEPDQSTGPDGQGAYEGSPAPDGTHWGRLRFTPSTCGSATVAVALRDDAGSPTDDGDDLQSASRSFNITVNCAPEADDDSYSTSFETALTVDDADDGVLANDEDDDGDGLTAVLVTEPENHASFDLNSDGTFQYVPKDGFSGTDTFTYKADDGKDSDEATVTITVGEPPEEGPDAKDDAYDTPYGSTLVVEEEDGVLQNDTGTGLTAVLDTGPTNAAGPFDLAADGSFTYTPADGFSGVDSFTYHARDQAGLVDTATVTITVGAPTAQVADPTQSILTADPTSIFADGATTSTVTLAVMDEQGEPFVDGAGIVQLTTGDAHTCALVDDGAVYCWGDNTEGQLGDGTDQDSAIPVRVAGISGAIAVAGGGVHTCAIVAEGAAADAGSVYCWGNNEEGQLGDGTTTSHLTPVAVVDLGEVTGIDAGIFHTCVVRVEQDVYCWGDGFFNEPQPVEDISDVEAVAAGLSHTCALRGDRSMWCWGSNLAGQLGNGNPAPTATPVVVEGLPPVAAMAVGDAHSCALTTDGFVFCWGANDDGQRGDADPEPRDMPGLVPLPAATAIAGGVYHTCAISEDDVMYCWGNNVFGQLGDGGTVGRSWPMAVEGLTGPAAATAGFFHTCALRTDGTASCWGDNSHGQVGDGTQTERHTPTDVSPILPYTITIGTDHGALTAPVYQGGGVFTALLTCDEPGTATLTATIDTEPVTDDATVECTLPPDPDNDPPTADDQSIDMVEGDGPRTNTLTGSDPEGDPFTFQIVGALSEDFTGSAPGLTYAPAQDHCTPTPISFQFQVQDDFGRTDTATVTIDVACVDDAPVAQPDEATVESGGTVAVDVLANDTDADEPYGDALSIVPFPEGATSDAGGLITVVDGLVVYEAPPGFASPPDDSFSYTIEDLDGTTAVGVVTVTVEPPNMPPEAIDGAATTEQETVTDITLQATDDHDAAAELHFQATSPTPSGGRVTVVQDVATYTPPPGRCGLFDTVRFTVTDLEGLSDVGEVQVAVRCPDAEARHGEHDGATPLQPPRGATRIEAVGGEHVTVRVHLPAEAPDGAFLAYGHEDGPALQDHEWVQDEGRIIFLAPVPQPGQTIVQTLHFTTRLGDAQSSPLIVEVVTHRDDAVPVVEASASATRTTAGQQILLDASASSHPLGLPLSFDWQHMSGPPVDLEGPTLAVASFTAPSVPAGDSATLVFAVTAESQGRSATAEVTVVVDGPALAPAAAPAARIEAVPRGDGTILFRAEGGETADYAWDFGDGSKAEGREVLHRFDQGGDFTVQLKVDDAAGSDTATKEVTVPDLAPVSQARAPAMLWVVLAAGGALLLGLLLVVALVVKRRGR